MSSILDFKSEFEKLIHERSHVSGQSRELKAVLHAKADLGLRDHELTEIVHSVLRRRDLELYHSS